MEVGLGGGGSRLHGHITIFALFNTQCGYFFKIALKMLSKIASQFAHSKNESCLPRTVVMALFNF